MPVKPPVYNASRPSDRQAAGILLSLNSHSTPSSVHHTRNMTRRQTRRTAGAPRTPPRQSLKTRTVGAQSTVAAVPARPVGASVEALAIQMYRYLLREMQLHRELETRTAAQDQLMAEANRLLQKFKLTRGDAHSSATACNTLLYPDPVSLLGSTMHDLSINRAPPVPSLPPSLPPPSSLTASPPSAAGVEGADPMETSGEETTTGDAVHVDNEYLRFAESVHEMSDLASSYRELYMQQRSLAEDVKRIIHVSKQYHQRLDAVLAQLYAQAGYETTLVIMRVTKTLAAAHHAHEIQRNTRTGADADPATQCPICCSAGIECVLPCCNHAICKSCLDQLPVVSGPGAAEACGCGDCESSVDVSGPVASSQSQNQSQSQSQTECECIPVINCPFCRTEMGVERIVAINL